MASPLVDIRKLDIGFSTELGHTQAVQGLSLRLERGKVMALVGESGSGKSATALSLLRLLPPLPTCNVTGEVLYAGEAENPVDLLQISSVRLREIRGNRIAMIFQEPMSSLNPVFTCGQQVMEAIRLHEGLGVKESREKTIELFDRVQLPDPARLLHRYPHQLSGGQKQRVMIAMAISCRPSLLICDEPTTALDVTVQHRILTLLRELQQSEQMAMLFITHDLGVVADIADRAAVLYRGSLIEEGAVSELFHHPGHPYTQGLLNCRPILHQRGERLPVVEDYLSEFKAKPETALPPAGFSTKDHASGEVLLAVDQLSVGYAAPRRLLGKPIPPIQAVDAVSFAVFRGETLGLVGESGCGKTSLGRALLGLVPIQSGTITWEGKPLSSYRGTALKEIRRSVQIVFQDPYSSLNPLLTVGAAIAEPLQVHRILRTQEQRRRRVQEWLDRVGLSPDHYFRYPHEFSGGQRQRVVIARALAMEPDFLVCDESVSALDTSVQAQVLNLLNDLKAACGFTMIFISHDLSVVRYLSDRIMVMNRGKIEEIGPAEDVYQHPKCSYTRQLIDSLPRGIA